MLRKLDSKDAVMRNLTHHRPNLLAVIIGTVIVLFFKLVEKWISFLLSRILLVENKESIFSHSRSRKGNSKREFTFQFREIEWVSSKKVCYRLLPVIAAYARLRIRVVLFFIIRDTFYDPSVTGVKEISSWCWRPKNSYSLSFTLNLGL
jgi:hypothetical protein